MTALTVRLPHSVHAKIRELAARDAISVNQFIASAAAEKLASMLTVDYLRQEAAQGQREALTATCGPFPMCPMRRRGELCP